MAGLAASTPCLAERTPCNDLRPHDSILPWVTASPVHGCEGWPEQPLWVKRRQACKTSVRIGVPASRLHLPERCAHCVCSAYTDGLQFEMSQFFKHGRFLKAFLSKQLFSPRSARNPSPSTGLRGHGHAPPHLWGSPAASTAHAHPCWGSSRKPSTHMTPTANARVDMMAREPPKSPNKRETPQGWEP